MKRRTIKRLTAGACIAAATVGLALAGATAAAASPVAPTVTMSSDQPFVVPSGSLPGAPSIFFLGDYFVATGADNIARFGVYISCDDGTFVPVSTTFWAGDARYGRLDKAQFTGTIPISEVGHTCVIHGWAPAGRVLAFDKPWNKPDEKDQPRLMFDSTTIIKNALGGL